MNDYTFVIMSQMEFSRELEELRTKLIGNKLVDTFPPHLTLKRRFTLARHYSPADLLTVLNNISLPKVVASQNKIMRLREVLIVCIESHELKMYNKALIESLSNMVVTKNPEYEGHSFTAHLILVRDHENKFKESDFSELKINEIVFNRMCLYEIDPTAERRFANQIACKPLL